MLSSRPLVDLNIAPPGWTIQQVLEEPQEERSSRHENEGELSFYNENDMAEGELEGDNMQQWI